MNTNNIFLNPGITVQVENGWVGWKIDDLKEREKLCQHKSAELFRKCLEAQAFAANETIKNFKSSKYFAEIIQFYTNTGNGLAHSVHLSPGMMTNQASSTARIELDPSLSYKIRVIDPKLEFLCANPDTIPNTKIVLGPNKGYVILYLKVRY